MLHNVVVSSLMSKPIHHGTKTDIGDSTLLTQPGSHGRRASGGCMPLACAFESSHTQATQKAHLTGELLAWLG